MRGRLLLTRFYNLLYPQYCLQCNERTDGEALFCADCAKRVCRLSGPVCFVCSAPFVSEAATSHSPSHRCGDCRENPPPFLKAITPYLYGEGENGKRGPLATAICKFKYDKQTALAAPLVRLLTDDLMEISADRVLAIPLHPTRLRSREFNQSLLLAQKIAKLLSLPYSIDAMARTRETPPQVGLSKKERAENMKGAFQVVRPKEIKDQRILLVDDVYTTGATLKEGARMLMQAGAKEVIAVTVARMV